MVDDLMVISKPEELLIMLNLTQADIHLELSEAELLLAYMEGSDYELGLRNGELVRHDIAEEPGEIEPYTMDEVIDTVCEWNYEMLEEAAKGMENPKDAEDYVQYKEAYDNLKSHEQMLDKMFQQTMYGSKTRTVTQDVMKKMFGSVPEKYQVNEQVIYKKSGTVELEELEQGKVR